MAKKRSTKAASSRKKTTAGRTAAKSKKPTSKRAKSDSTAETAAPKLAQATLSQNAGQRGKRAAKTVTKTVRTVTGNGDSTQEREPLTEAQLRKVKTGLTKRDLDGFRKLLLEKRAEIIGDVTSLEGDLNNSGGNLSSMPMHMADIGSDNYEQEFNLGLVESERKLLREIDDALLRIHKGIYGVCIETGVPINRARLDAKPWAKYCIEVAREKEKLAGR